MTLQECNIKFGKLLNEIQKVIDPYLECNATKFLSLGTGVFTFSGDFVSEAFALQRKKLNPVKVVKMNSDYWLYLNLAFHKIQIETSFTNEKKSPIKKSEYLMKLKQSNLEIQNEYYDLIVSISIFKGGLTPESKLQLFRAEWDNNAAKDGRHPQPHWHFYQIEEYQKQMRELKSDTFDPDNDSDGFTDFIDKNSFLNRFHFAMNGNWINDDSHIHTANSEERIKLWFTGLFSHLDEQIKYLIKRVPAQIE